MTATLRYLSLDIFYCICNHLFSLCIKIYISLFYILKKIKRCFTSNICYGNIIHISLKMMYKILCNILQVLCMYGIYMYVHVMYVMGLQAYMQAAVVSRRKRRCDSIYLHKPTSYKWVARNRDNIQSTMKTTQSSTSHPVTSIAPIVYAHRSTTQTHRVTCDLSSQRNI